MAIFTLWYLSVKYDDNPLEAVPDMRYYINKRSTSMLWSIVSIAADKSSKESPVTLPLSIFRVTSLCTFQIAVSIERNCLQADCNTLDIQFYSV